jgi:hypothetical protein
MYLDAHNLSIIVNVEERTCHADTSSPHVSTSEWTEPGTDFYYAVKPNQMTYVDDTVVSRSIHIPRGKNEELYRLFENQNWKALSLSPAWSM